MARRRSPLAKALPVSAVVVLVGAIVFMGSMNARKSPEFRAVLRVAEAHPAVVDSLGVPLKVENRFIGGTCSTTVAGTRKKSFDATVSGPNGRGRIVAEVHGHEDLRGFVDADDWDVVEAKLWVDGRAGSTNLLAKDPRPEWARPPGPR